jgi:hypothetical protein
LEDDSDPSCEIDQDLYIDIFDNTDPDKVGGCSGSYKDTDRGNED